MRRGDDVGAEKVLGTLMSRDEASEQLQELKRERKQVELGSAWTFASVVRSTKLRKPLLLLCLLHIGQQLSGINAVFYYSTATFQKVGMTLQQSQSASIGAAGLNVAFAVIAIPLIAHFRKRSLLLFSASVSAFTMIVFTVSITLQVSKHARLLE